MVEYRNNLLSVTLHATHAIFRCGLHRPLRIYSVRSLYAVTVCLSNHCAQSINQSINQSIRAVMQVDKPQRDRVNEYITVPC